MGTLFTTFIFTLGVGAWVYNKVMQRNGGLTQQALIAAGVCAVVAAIVFFTLFTAITNRLG